MAAPLDGAHVIAAAREAWRVGALHDLWSTSAIFSCSPTTPAPQSAADTRLIRAVEGGRGLTRDRERALW